MVGGTDFKCWPFAIVLTISVLYLESRRSDRGIVVYRKWDIDGTIL